MLPMTARTAVGALCLTLGLAAPLQAACIDGYFTTRETYDRGQRTPVQELRVNQLLVLCFTVTEPGHIAVHDAPSQGDFESLYPNVLTHPGGETSAPVEANREYCFGGSDTFPMYHPASEGLGRGKVSIALTKRAEDQLSADDFAIPGKRVARDTMELHLQNHRSGSELCSDRELIWIDYTIVE